MRSHGRPVAKLRRSAGIRMLNLKVKAIGERPSVFLNRLSRERFSFLASTNSALLLPSFDFFPRQLSLGCLKVPESLMSALRISS